MTTLDAGDDGGKSVTYSVDCQDRNVGYEPSQAPIQWLAQVGTYMNSVNS